MTNPDTTTDERNSATDSHADDGTVSRRTFVAVAGTAAVAAAGAGTAVAMGDGRSDDGHSITVRLENVSDGETLTTSGDGDASAQPVPLSPLVYAVHSKDEPVFTHGESARGNGLQGLAEDGMPGTLAESLMERDTVVDAGAVAVADGADEAGPLTPGHAYEFEAEVTNGSPRPYLSLLTMFVPSNDLFYAVGGAAGMALREDGSPVAGNVTDRVTLWDAGTEVNQEPGVGGDQPQRQRATNVGDVERAPVVPVSEVNGYDYPDASDVLELMVTPN